MPPDDAVQLQRSGADAIQVSSLGWGQLENAPASIDMLRLIRTTVRPDVPQFLDGELRFGEDALKALNAGANFAFFGRSFKFAMAAAGAAGLEQLWSVFTQKLLPAIARTGCGQFDLSPRCHPK